jgi:hypothetical protein
LKCEHFKDLEKKYLVLIFFQFVSEFLEICKDMNISITETIVDVSVLCDHLNQTISLGVKQYLKLYFFTCALFDHCSLFRTQFGRTEMIKDTLNPDFVHKFVMNYFFEESQKLKFEV